MAEEKEEVLKETGSEALEAAQEVVETAKETSEPEQEERKLTAAEQRRLENFEKIAKELEAQGYEKKNLTTTAALANTLGFGYGIILAVLFGVPYVIGGFNKTGVAETPVWGILTMVLFLVSIVIHELIHGITWSIGMKGGFHNVEFGFIVQYLTPYCTCKVPMKKARYILGSLMPCIVLGIVPCILSYLTGSAYLLAFGVLMIISAGGDLLVTQMILTNKAKGKEQLYFDHPTEIGLALFEKP